ncbi:MAG: carboxylating nicotinate-nucleotide diphosphorylase [Gammaproteobacteria bacterium]
MDLLKTVDEVVQRALIEDIQDGDLTASLLPDDSRSKTRVITREKAIICGRPWFDSVFDQLDKNIKVKWLIKEGEMAEANQELCHLEGLTKPILTGERTALNFLQTLSATATATHNYVEVLKGTKTKLLDTRKTIPGLRDAQKYAVKTGGGKNHRIGLYDGILLKENHIDAAGSITAAVVEAKKRYPEIPVEVEVENMDQLSEAIEAGTDIIMLDNFDNDQMREAVRFTAGRSKLEASGGYNKETLRAAAETGVDYISVGALTKHIKAVDLSMRFVD